MKTTMKTGLSVIAALALLSVPALGLADEIDTGDTAWLLTSTALVLFMTIPGLSLFYAGLVRSKNVLSVLMQCFSITCLASILWLLYGYSLAFTDSHRSKKLRPFGASKCDCLQIQCNPLLGLAN